MPPPFRNGTIGYEAALSGLNPQAPNDRSLKVEGTISQELELPYFYKYIFCWSDL